MLLLVAVLWDWHLSASEQPVSWAVCGVFNAARFMLAAALLLPFAVRRSLASGQVMWMVTAGVILFTASAAAGGPGDYDGRKRRFLRRPYVVLVPFVLFIGWREKPRLTALISVALAAFGAYLVSAGPVCSAGDLLELGGAGFWGIHVVLFGKYASRFEAVSFSAGQMAGRQRTKLGRGKDASSRWSPFPPD